MCVADSGQLFTWGRNNHGKLGHQSDFNEVEPRRVAFFKDLFVKDIHLGRHHALILAGNPDDTLTAKLAPLVQHEKHYLRNTSLLLRVHLLSIIDPHPPLAFPHMNFTGIGADDP